MRRSHLCFGFCLAFTLLVSSVSAQSRPASSSPDRAAIREFLQHWRGSVVNEADWVRIQKMGKQAFPLLAGFLSDPELGSYAESIMERIAPEDVTLYLLKDLDQRDVFVQRQVFLFANQRIQEYALYVRQGKPTPEPPGFHGYRSNTKPVTYLPQLHKAAVQMLRSQTDATTLEQILLSLGLAGNKSDIALLKHFNTPTSDLSRQRELQTANLAALAHLGDEETLALLERELQKPVPSVPALPFVMTNGDIMQPRASRMISDAEEQRLHAMIFAAGFSMNRRFVPCLIAHTADPPRQYRGDYPGPDPAMKARDALAQIVSGKALNDGTDWKAWWQVHQHEYITRKGDL